MKLREHLIAAVERLDTTVHVGAPRAISLYVCHAEVPDAVDEILAQLGMLGDLDIDTETTGPEHDYAWVLHSYKDGYPTSPLAVYASPPSAFADLEGVWTEHPNGYGGLGGFSSHDADGVAIDLIRFEVKR